MRVLSKNVWTGLRFLVVAAVFPFISQPAQSAPVDPTWQAEWVRTVRTAEKEGEVAFYTLGDSHNYLSDFQKRFPKIKVNMALGRGSELLSRIMTERRAGKYLVDVARIGNTSPYGLYRAKALQPISAAFILPEVKDESKWLPKAIFHCYGCYPVA